MKMPTQTLAFTLSIIASLFSIAAFAETQPGNPPAETAIPEEVERYSLELGNLISNPTAGAGVEELLQMGRKASAALVRPPRGERVNVLERLSEKEFQEVSLKMKGFFVNREETIYVEPDPHFFAALAKRSGDQVSMDFFDDYSKTIPNTWPIYIEQQTDYSGCIRYGTMSLVDTYTLWSTYSKKHPTRYVAEVMNFIRRVEDDLAGGICACNDKESVVREFKAIIQAYPQAKVSTRLRERINQIQQGKSDIREHCHSG